MTAEYAPPPKCPTIRDLIEDFGVVTHEPCIECLNKKRHNALVQIRASAETGDWFLVCPYCDVGREVS